MSWKGFALKNNLVLVDTSVWIFALKKNPVDEIKSLVDELLRQRIVAITSPIKLEILSGLKSREQFDRMSLRLNALYNLPINDSTWDLATILAFNLRKKGITIPYMDLLISATALESNVSLIHADNRFDILAKETSLKTNNYIKLVK